MPRAIILIAYILIVGNLSNGRTPTQTIRGVVIDAGQHDFSESIRLDRNNPVELTPLHQTDNVEGKAILSSVITHRFSPRLTVRSGVNAGNNFYRMKGDSRDRLTGEYGRFLQGSGNSWLIQGHSQVKYMVNRDFSLSAGYNASWFQLNQELNIEPRLTAGWQVNAQHRFSLGYGNHSQAEPLFVYYVSRKNEPDGSIINPNRNLGRSRAHHFVLGWDWSPVVNFRVKTEPYFQSLYYIPVVDGTSYSMINFLADWTFDKPLVNNGTGTNKGIDITVERFLKDGYYFMSTASIYDSRYTGGDGVEHKTRYDGGHIFNLLGGKEWKIRDKNLFGINIKITLMGPYWHYPVDKDASHLEGDIVYDETQPFNYRHSDLESINDMTATYRINGKNRSSVTAIQVKNLIGRQYQGKQYHIASRKIENDFFSSPVPFVSYKLEF